MDMNKGWVLLSFLFAIVAGFGVRATADISPAFGMGALATVIVGAALMVLLANSGEALKTQTQNREIWEDYRNKTSEFVNRLMNQQRMQNEDVLSWCRRTFENVEDAFTATNEFFNDISTQIPQKIQALRTASLAAIDKAVLRVDAKQLDAVSACLKQLGGMQKQVDLVCVKLSNLYDQVSIVVESQAKTERTAESVIAEVDSLVKNVLGQLRLLQEATIAMGKHADESIDVIHRRLTLAADVLSGKDKQ